MTLPEALEPSASVRASFEQIRNKLGAAREELASTDDIVTTRPGYLYPPGLEPVPAIVVAVIPGTSPVRAQVLEARWGVPVTVTDATVEEQLAAVQRPAMSFGTSAGATASSFERMLSGDTLLDFAPPKTGTYETVEPTKLVRVKEKMKLTVCVSPEAGWSELESFLSGTEETLTVAMYQFTAPHIFEALENALTPAGRKFELILHPVPEKPAKSGVKANDLDEEAEIIEPLQKAMDKRFELAWATLTSNASPEGLFASAYHIKVAVRDSDTFWLSSGNWQSSNQPNVRPFATHPEKLPPQFQRKYNRDYHTIIENETLADIYEFYIKRDFELSTEQAGGTVAFAAPDLFVPDEEEEADEPVAFAPPKLFEPLRLDREIDIQPLLTPDNYAEQALALIMSAKKSVWFQNQYINFRGTDEDFIEFRALVGALKKKIDEKLDVRIICRDLMKQESLDVLVALGFPKEALRFQPACHNKTIIVDAEVVMFGSHNWSNEGVKTNRDASLIFFDREVAEYLAEVYDHDWTTLATAHPSPARSRVAKPGETTPKGLKRVPFSAVFDDGP